ncbi:MAG TPA: DUF397 domain-containing protein [Nocardiopsis listeri]|uniref:DUF397 domain-containing protein n=1 Tax=Nocardiopsis listeri TaxID=53440 RepID=UPI001D9AE2BB|nr:DUF397 domain-containing protein [Nocardiopsis listeri]HJE60087.1 DUF397 domain-containing protein [Nocardiopsis listeri]
MREQWYKSSYSKASGECVEAARSVSGECGMRDSRQPDLGHLMFSSMEWSTFVSSMKGTDTPG